MSPANLPPPSARRQVARMVELPRRILLSAPRKRERSASFRSQSRRSSTVRELLKAVRNWRDISLAVGAATTAQTRHAPFPNGSMISPEFANLLKRRLLEPFQGLSYLFQGQRREHASQSSQAQGSKNWNGTSMPQEGRAGGIKSVKHLRAFG